MRRRILTAVLAVAAVTFVACGDEEPTIQQPPAQNRLGVDMSEYKFTFLGQPKTGQLTMTFRNSGRELHFAEILRLDAGKTKADVDKFFDDPEQLEGPTPSWIKPGLKGLSLLSPGQSWDLTVDASQSATYLFACFLPAPNGKTHAALGMYDTIEITGTSDASPPQTSRTFTISPDVIGTPAIAAGTTTVAVRNNSALPGDFLVVRLQEGKTLADLGAWFESFEGPPPATFLGGTDGIEAGKTALMTYRLQRGTYVAIATFEEDQKEKRATQTFTIT